MSSGETRGMATAFALAAAILILLPRSALARQPGGSTDPIVQGVVTEAGPGTPVTGALVSVVSGSQVLSAVLTGDDGSYSIPLAGPGTYSIRAERVGYQPAEQGPYTLPATGTFRVDFLLAPEPILLDSILVRVRRQGREIGPGEQLVYGRLMDDENGAPIPQGTVELLRESGSEGATTLSNDDGLFWLVSPRPGTYRIRAGRIGYATSEGPEFQLMLGDTLGVDFYLSVDAIVMAPMVVTASARDYGSRYNVSGMEGFFDRYGRYSRSGFGEFLIRDSIAEYEGHYTSTGHMLAMNFPSVRRVLSGGGRNGQVILQGVTPPTGFGPPGVCVPTYFIDGSEIPPEAVADGMVNPMGMYPPEMLEGVEVYTQPTIPAEFLRGEWPCGVVALWTRRDPGGPGAGIPGWKKAVAGATLVLLAIFVGR